MANLVGRIRTTTDVEDMADTNDDMMSALDEFLTLDALYADNDVVDARYAAMADQQYQEDAF